MVNNTDTASGDQQNSTASSDPPSGDTAAAGTSTMAQAAEKPKMRAVILSSFGGLKGVKTGERPVPNDPAQGQVTIQIKISGMNFQDLMVRLGVVDSLPKNPFILGSELVGTVTAIGEGVENVKVNDTVFALPEYGAWAEYVNVDSKLVWKCDETIGLEKLASTLPYLLADLLVERAGAQEGSYILIHSAGGSVGLAVRDLAKLKGINVIGIASQWKFDKLEGFASLIDRSSDYVAEVKKLHPGGIRTVLDPQGGDDCSRGISLLAPWGTYLLYGSANIVTGETKSFFSLAKSWWQVEKVSPLKLYEDNKSIAGLHLRQLIKNCPEIIENTLKKIWKLMKDGTIQPTIDITYSFERVTLAMQRMHDRKNVGKILIVPESAEDPVAPEAEPEKPSTSTNGTTDSAK